MEDQDIRDELIDLLLSESNGGLREYIMDRRRRLLEREREAERSALESEYQQAYHMSVDEYEAYIDEQARELELRNKDFDISEYNGILADEYEKYRHEHDTTGKSETDGRGGEILHSQGSAERGGEADGVGREPRGEVADSCRAILKRQLWEKARQEEDKETYNQLMNGKVIYSRPRPKN